MLTLPTYINPDFTQEPFVSSPDAVFVAADGGALPGDFFACTVFPEYVKIGGAWRLLKASRPDCVIALRGGEPVHAKARRRQQCGGKGGGGGASEQPIKSKVLSK